MSRVDASSPQFQSLLWAACRDDVTQEELAQLEQLADADSAMQLLVDYLQLDGELHRIICQQSSEDKCFKMLEVNAFSNPEATEQFKSISPVLPLFSTIARGTLGYFSSGWPMAYLVATVVMAVALLIGSHVYMSSPEQLARQSAPNRTSNPQTLIPNLLPKTPVGRITGMVDCQFDGSKTQDLRPKTIVSLGDRFALASGLLEITYDTGAKVILQGPVTYEVESKDGGFLSLGKLTARLEKSEIRNPKSETISKSPNLQISKSQVPKTQDPRPKSDDGIHHSSFIPHPLFFVRTPTATVTDLGTEFGVEVTNGGITEAHVFVGKVRMNGQKGPNNHVQERFLIAGQAMQVGSLATASDIRRSDEKRFVRTMPVSIGAPPPLPELISQVDYSDTWTANSSTRAGSSLLLDDPVSLQVEQCHGNPPRSWVFSTPSTVTTWPSDNCPVLWPGHRVRGSRSGFMETCSGDCHLGIEYGLRDDFVVQFDAVQTDDRIGIIIGDEPATIHGRQALSVFFRITQTPKTTSGGGFVPPEIGLCNGKRESNTSLSSGIADAWRWHNYAVRFSLPTKRLTVWIDYQCRGTIDLATITQGLDPGHNSTWANLPWTNRYVSVGGHATKPGRIWIDNFRVGAPSDIATPRVRK